MVEVVLVQHHAVFFLGISYALTATGHPYAATAMLVAGVLAYSAIVWRAHKLFSSEWQRAKYLGTYFIAPAMAYYWSGFLGAAYHYAIYHGEGFNEGYDKSLMTTFGIQAGVATLAFVLCLVQTWDKEG